MDAGTRRDAGTLHIHQRGQRVSRGGMFDHVDADLSDGDGALDADGDVVGVVGDPDGHLFAALEHRAFDEEGFEFDAAEFSIVGADGLLAEVTDIKIIDLAVE